MEYNRVDLIPRSGMLEQLLARLESRASSMRDLVVCRAERSVTSIAKISVELAHEHVPLIDKLRDYVDLALVRGVHHALEKEYLRLRAEDATTELSPGSVLYTPTGAPHEGRQSPTSSARYWFRIKRPIPGDRDAELMVQHLTRDGKSTHHFHYLSIEHWLSLAGRTFLHATDALQHSTVRVIAGRAFETAFPKTAHQLQTLEREGLNVLCIEPYRGLDDHHYVGNDAPTLYRGSKNPKENTVKS